MKKLYLCWALLGLLIAPFTWAQNNVTGTVNDETGDTLLEQILEEKYITLVGEIVTFHDLRRTRNFIGVPNKTTGSTGASDFPQRFLYPQSEVDTNSNVPSPLPEFFSTAQLLGASY